MAAGKAVISNTKLIGMIMAENRPKVAIGFNVENPAAKNETEVVVDVTNMALNALLKVNDILFLNDLLN